MLVVETVTNLRFSRGIGLAGSIGINQATVRVQVNSSNVQGLLKVAYEMCEHKESFLLVGDRIWPDRVVSFNTAMAALIAPTKSCSFVPL